MSDGPASYNFRQIHVNFGAILVLEDTVPLDVWTVEISESAIFSLSFRSRYE